MVSLPRDVSPGARGRRSLLFDLILALALAAVAIALAAGIGVVGFFAALTALALLLWVAIEGGVRWLLRRRRRRAAGFSSSG
jgi:hypothetical protein